MFLIQRELAEAYEAGRISPTKDGFAEPTPGGVPGGLGAPLGGGAVTGPAVPVPDSPPLPLASMSRLVWSGEVPHQKWMNFYTKVLSKFASTPGLKLTLRVEVAPVEGLSTQKVDETKVALRELGLKDTFESN